MLQHLQAQTAALLPTAERSFICYQHCMNAAQHLI